jgi:hypothetical protein
VRAFGVDAIEIDERAEFPSRNGRLTSRRDTSSRTRARNSRTLRRTRAARTLHCATSMSKLIAASFTALVLSLGAGCQEVDRAFDCAQICDRWRDCADSNYDVDTCTERCEDDAAAEPAFDQHADQCENCLDERTCGQSLGCATECIGIVP